jgi:hypothetical protein
LCSHAAALVRGDTLDSVKEGSSGTETSVDAHRLLALVVIVVGSSAGTSAGLSLLKVDHTVSAGWCGTERFRSPVQGYSTHDAGSGILSGGQALYGKAILQTSRCSACAHVGLTESFELNWADD